VPEGHRLAIALVRFHSVPGSVYTGSQVTFLQGSALSPLAVRLQAQFSFKCCIELFIGMARVSSRRSKTDIGDIANADKMDHASLRRSCAR